MFFSPQHEGKDTQQELNEDLKGAVLAAYQGPSICTPKVGDIWGRARAVPSRRPLQRLRRGNSAPAETGLPALSCCSSLFTYYGGVRAQEEILTRRLRRRALRSQGPGHMWDSLISTAPAASANASPKSRAKTLSWAAPACILPGDWSRGEEVLQDVVTGNTETLGIFWGVIFRKLLNGKMLYACRARYVFHTGINNAVR